MNLAELFVNLGVKGSDKTVGALTTMRKGLKETADMSFEAKAAIVGAMYALERLFAKSSERGTDLTNFNSLVGVSAKTLQQYQYAARQVGVANDEVAGTFKALQSTMTKTLMGEGAPKGLARLAQLTGAITPDDLKKFAEQPQLLLQRLQDYASKEKNVGFRNEVLKSFGVGDNMAAALTRGAFRPDVLSKAPTYSDSEIKTLDKVNAAWGNLGNKIQMAVGHFNAAHGGELVGNISKVTDSVLRLADAFVKLSEKAHLFGWLQKVFEGWTAIFEGITAAVEALQEATAEDAKANQTLPASTKQDQESATFKYSSAMSIITAALGAIAEKFSGNAENTTTPAQKRRYENALRGLKPEPEKGLGDLVGEQVHVSIKDGKLGIHLAKPPEPPKVPQPVGGAVAGSVAALTGITPEVLAKMVEIHNDTKPRLKIVVPPPIRMDHVAPPRLPLIQPAAGAGKQSVEFNQSLHFSHPATDPKKTADSTKKAVNDAYRQIGAQGQGS